MKRFAVLIIFGLVYSMLNVILAANGEISLFDSKGVATAYIAEDLTIYLWAGKPVAYLVNDPFGGFHIYGFNGRHLGWFESGIIYDHQGYAVGAVKEAFLRPPSYEPIKGLKALKPLKSLRELPPLKPIFMKKWANTSLKLFLLQGLK